ncbi:hypothetical protein M1P56_35910 (plasmid) [Streptomyces sp. HU2014]|uniref:hypothetical protein n=1 Tax=Streptomyces sp. HU2014 TaxID=2939414 RepID=UPI00200D2B36|nr:hypothetical protein [Streptomyces sp. HU2014]UQI49790.1 hypothetical protein M1P56_35910 [Streptomyces sp. HU2014]
MDTCFGAFTIDNAELRPVYDPALRTFCVQLWNNGEPAGSYGLVESFPDAEELVETIDGFLAKHDVRPLDLPEMARLYGALLAAKGGPDFQLFLTRPISRIR